MRPFAYRSPSERAADGRSCFGGPAEVSGTGAPPETTAPAVPIVAAMDDVGIEQRILALVGAGPKTGRELGAAFPGQYTRVALVREQLVTEGRLRVGAGGRYELVNPVARVLSTLFPPRPELAEVLHAAIVRVLGEPGERRRIARERSHAAIRDAERRLRRTGGPTPPDHVRSPPWHASRTFARRQM